MMNTMMSAVALPLPRLVRASAFAVLAMVAVGGAQLWQHHGGIEVAPAAATVDASQPLVAAPSAVDMWNV